jgi:ribonucleoside-diphosphate reductase alpha subunit
MSSDSSIFVRLTIDGIDKVAPLREAYIQTYLQSICAKINAPVLDINRILNNVYPKLKKINTIEDIDNQIIASVSEMATDHYIYMKIGTYLLVRDLHKSTKSDYGKVVDQLITNKDAYGRAKPILSKSFVDFVHKYQKEINAELKYERDYEISLFGYRALEKIYLKKNVKGCILERPQHLFMRTAIAIHYRASYGSVEKKLFRIFETYNLMSQGYFTHATPTLFNAGSLNEQLSSCFLMGIEDDMERVGDCWKETGVISKYGGGIGIHVTKLRHSGAYINSTQGKASGMAIAPVLNSISRYAHQGCRPGSFAIYIEPWHADIMYFLDLKKNTGAETDRARDLFLALTINDIFMERVKSDGIWSLMCPSECPDLLDKFGEEFSQIYIRYESEGKFIRQIPAREVWFKILESQIESGVPYMLYKDSVNKKSNQSNIGVINGSNLCIEIVEVSTADEYAVCNLCSICLPKFFEKINGVVSFNYQKLYEIARVACRNLNNIIDINFYPLDKARKSNLSHRPIGIGVQGLADLFFLFKISFDSEQARDLNKKIFETIYYGFLSESADLAVKYGSYTTFEGSPISQGKFQFDLWGDSPSGMWDWESLRTKIISTGVRNSLGVASMPTASTSLIMGNTEACEAITSNIYSRSTISGDYYVVNKFLMDDLMELGLWNSDMVDLIKYSEGSIQHIDFIPDHIKQIYRTVWEIDQKSIIEMARDRAPFIDQTQSMNIFMAKNKFYPDDHYVNKPMNIRVSSSHFYAWELGLKTGMYYLRTKPAAEANQFGIDIDKIKELEAKYKLAKAFEIDTESKKIDYSKMVCELRPSGLADGEACMMCGS